MPYRLLSSQSVIVLANNSNASCFSNVNGISSSRTSKYLISCDLSYGIPFSSRIAFIKNSTACYVSKQATSKNASSSDTERIAFFACRSIAIERLYIVLIYYDSLLYCIFHYCSIKIPQINNICSAFCNNRNRLPHISCKRLQYTICIVTIIHPVNTDI